MRPTQRRICRPEPELSCLIGTCQFCNQSPYRELIDIEGELDGEDQWEAWRRGKDDDFGVAQTRRGR